MSTGVTFQVLPDHDVVDDLDAVLRAQVKRRGVDPQRESDLVRQIAHQVVRDHDDRSLTGVVSAVADRDGLVAALVANVSGFGALQPFLDDPSVEEIWINEPSRVR